MRGLPLGIEHYVYFIKCNNYLKIGTTSRLGCRFTSLQSANPYELELIGAINLDSKYDALNLEKIILKKFDHYRVRGEWFIYKEDIIDFIYNECNLSIQGVS